MERERPAEKLPVQEMPTKQDADLLLAFLPLFELRGRVFVKNWSGGEKLENGAITLPYPVYEDDVDRFQEVLCQPCWTDTTYDPKRAELMLGDDAALAKATLPEIRSMLTYIVRGERFCDGHMGALLKSGRVTLLLKRLQEVVKESWRYNEIV